MDSSQTREKNAVQEPGEKKSADPFASDIFAVSPPQGKNAPETASKVETEKPKIQLRRLPKAARPAIDWNDLQRSLPPDFSAGLPQMLADSLAGQLNLGEDNPIEILSLLEREISSFGEQRNNSWWLNVGIETSEAEFAVEIDDVFAVWLVDAALGEKKSDVIQIREFTSGEIAVLEFLAVNLTHETNKNINAPLFKFRGFSRKHPDWSNQTDNSENSMLVVSWQTVHGLLNSIIKLYVTPPALNALNANENKLLTAAPRRRTLWNALQNRVADVRARLFLGEVPTTLAEAAGLETGDVVLPESHNYSIGDGLRGKAVIFLGDGEQVGIGGAFVLPAAESPVEFEENPADGSNEILVRRVKSNHALRLVVERFEESDVPHLLEKSMSNEPIESIEPSADSGAGGIALENLAVTLRVELEARRLSLAEVGNLRINQIIELGISAADPVNLLIDNKTVARGELVEVEDRLGVRIVQILR